MKPRCYLLSLQINVLATLMGLSLAGHAQSVVKFDVPGAPSETRPQAVNIFGQITGSYLDADGHTNGFVRSAGGAFSSFHAPRVGDFSPDLGTRPQAINDAGQIVGYVTSQDGPALIVRGFVRDEYGMITVFDAIPGSIETLPEVINSEGTVAGTYFDPGFTMHGFVRSPQGAITTFDGLETFGQVLGIRSNGEVDGLFRRTDHEFHGFVLQPSGMFSNFDEPDVGSHDTLGIGCPDCSGTLPTAATPTGRIVGYYGAASNVIRGFLREADGVFSNFAVPEALATMPKAINLQGAIAGEYIDAAHLVHGFLLPRNGASESIDLPDSDALTVTGIDRDNRVSGYFLDSSGIHGFIRNPRAGCRHRR